MARRQREEQHGEIVLLGEFAKACELEIVGGTGVDSVYFSTVNINRPGLLLAGFEDYFGDARVQVIGNAEHYYLESCSQYDRQEKIESLFSKKIPCVIFARGITPSYDMINIAYKHNVPLLKSEKLTSELVNDLVNYFNELLAPTLTMHGVLLETSGIGVLLTGKSGMGKSETALELVHRGHRLVADDTVIIKKIKNDIVGMPPDKIKHFMEIRGIGIIDVRNMFGVGSVLNKKNIDLVIEFEVWGNNKEYDRLGLDDITQNIFGVEIPKLIMPVMPGRNLAIVVEVAARNLRLKKMGYNAVDQLLSNVKFSNVPNNDTLTRLLENKDKNNGEKK